MEKKGRESMLNNINLAVSVGIPAYDEEKYIGRCLRSLERQTYRGFEVIICLGPCTDLTKDVALKFAQGGRLNLKIVREEDRGIAKARQRAFERASGDIIVSGDADTEYPPYWLERIRKDFVENPGVVAVCGPVRHKEAKGLARIYLNCFYPSINTLARQASDLLGLVNVIGSNLAVRKAAFERVGGFNTSLRSFEDNELAKRLREEGEILHDPKLVAYPSARRYNGLGVFKVPLWNIKNYAKVILFEMEGDGFKDAR